MIVADTGAVIALLDADDRHHRALTALYRKDPPAWVLPWAILPEVDYLAAKYLGQRAQDAFLADVADGAFRVEWGSDADLVEAARLHRKHRGLRLGLVDACVIAVAERLGADAVATLDLRHLAPVPIRGTPRLFPRDL